MKCLNCNSENVSYLYSLPATQQPKSIFWWLLIGWWLRPILWLVTHIWRLFGRGIDHSGGKDLSSETFICQNCGYSWPRKSSE